MKKQYGSYNWILKLKISSLLMIGLLYGISISTYATTYPFEGRWTTGNSDDCSDPVEFTSTYMRYGMYDVFYSVIERTEPNLWQIRTNCSVGILGGYDAPDEAFWDLDIAEKKQCYTSTELSLKDEILTYKVLYFYGELVDYEIKYHRCNTSDKKEIVQTTEQNQSNSSSIKLDEPLSVLFNSKITNKLNQNILLKDNLSKNINNDEVFTIDINKKITNNNYHKNLVTKLNKLAERLISFRFLAQPYNQCFNFDEYQLHQLMEQKYVI